MQNNLLQGENKVSSPAKNTIDYADYDGLHPKHGPELQLFDSQTLSSIHHADRAPKKIKSHIFDRQRQSMGNLHKRNFGNIEYVSVRDLHAYITPRQNEHFFNGTVG